jgi:exosortase
MGKHETLSNGLDGRRLLLAALFLGGVCLWSYWPILCEMARKWGQDSQYSHSYLVPVFAAVLLYLRRHQLQSALLRPSWLGYPLLAAGVAVRLVGTYYYLDWLPGASLLFVLAGAVLLLGGRHALRWAWLSIVFLVFMLPLPHRLEVGMAHPLQRVATLGSTYLLQTLGLPALSEGNVIVMNEFRIGVVEACNGLGMLLVFFALATGVAILIQRDPLEKLVLVVSAIPIAIVVNIGRITATGLLYVAAGRYWADLLFHDLAGWLMMPVALGLIWLELQVLARLFVEVPPARPLAVSSGAALRGPKQSGRRPDRRREDRPAPALNAGPVSS